MYVCKCIYRHIINDSLLFTGVSKDNKFCIFPNYVVVIMEIKNLMVKKKRFKMFNYCFRYTDLINTFKTLHSSPLSIFVAYIITSLIVDID